LYHAGVCSDVIIVLLLYHAGVCSDVIIVLLLYHAGVCSDVIIVLLLYHAGVCSDVIIVLLLYHAGVAHLHGYTVEGSEVSGRKFSFSLLPPEPQMRKFSFVAENDTDKQRWGCMPLTFYCQELLLLMYMLFYKPFEEGPFLEH